MMQMQRSFYFLWAGQSSFNLASALLTISLTTLVYHLTDSATIAALIALFRVIAKVVSSFFVSVLTEKLSLKSILVFSQLVLASLLFFLIIIIIFMFNINLIPIILLFVLIMTYFEGWVVPAKNSFIPRLVEKNKLMKANSYLSTTDQLLSLLGWSMGGVFIFRYGEKNVLWLTLILFILSIISFILIKDKGETTQELSQSKKTINWASAKDGWVTIFRNPKLRIINMMDIIEGVASGIWIGGISLVFVKEVLTLGEQWWGYINSSYYLGTIVGGLIILMISGWMKQHLILGISIGSFGVSILVLLYSFNTVPVISLLFVFLMGPFYQLRDISQRTYIQENTDVHLLPKIYSAADSLYYITFGFSVFLMGLIADYFNVRAVYLLAAILYFASSIIGLSRGLRIKKDSSIES